MLVLSRRKSEEIMIGDDVSIMVVEIRGDKVRIGINAPKHIKVHRKEIWLEMQKGMASEQCVNAEMP
jgi:carbon storage regulator